MHKKQTLLFCAGAKHPDLSVIKHYDIDCFIGVDGGAKVLKDNNIPLDFAIGDFDSVEVVDAKEVVTLPCEKDETDLQFALTYVLSQFDEDNIEKIIIIGALGGGRIDHLICNYYLAYDENYRKWLSKIVFMEKNNTIYFITPGEYTLYKESDRFYLSIIGMTPLKQLTIMDAKYTLAPTDTPYPKSYISNEFINKPAKISFEEGLVCIMQTTDRMQS